MSTYTLYEGTGATLDEAISKAHALIPMATASQRSDYMHSRVIEFGKRTGGFVQEDIFYARVAQTEPHPQSSETDTPN